MLNRELLRCKIVDGRMLPSLLRVTPGTVEQAERLIAYWRGGVGQRRGDLEDGAMPLLHQSRALLVGRGLQKLILDGCRFRDAASSEILRGAALAASAARMAAPAATVTAHREAVAAELGLHPDELVERLYGDLPDAAVLEEAPAQSARQLIDHYNLALCQGLLLQARELRVTIDDADTGLRRRILKALRFRRLLATVRCDNAAVLDLVVSGPGNVLDQATRYGVQLALFLPAVACARRWSVRAELPPPRHEGPGRGTVLLELDQDTGLVGDSHFLGHLPDELRGIADQLAAKLPGWSVEDGQLLPLPSGELVVPDLQVGVDGALFPVELFHRWHGSALGRRLALLEQGVAPRLVIGVDRALSKTAAVAPLLASPAFARHGFLFSDLPTARALREAVERLRASPAGP